MWLHRENEFEWKFCGIWLDMVEDSIFKTALLQRMTDARKDEIFLCFKPYESAVEMFSDNLQIRNRISSIRNDPKLSSEERDEGIKSIEEKTILSINTMDLNDEVIIYLNGQDRFIKIDLPDKEETHENNRK